MTGPTSTALARRTAGTRETERCHDLDYYLRRFFRKTHFRPLQREVIQASLDGHDVFLQAATSFGKSLCFQLPAVIEHGITIVISPLLSLMNDQVAALRDAGIAADGLNRETPAADRRRIYSDLSTGHPRTRLLYVTPESCSLAPLRDLFLTVYRQREFARLAVDEAHCVSEWGHDFRPAFKALRWFRESCPDVPMMCLTATATAKVRRDVMRLLGLAEPSTKIFTMTTSRPNLHYEVRYTSDAVDQFDDFLPWLQAIYARRRRPERAAELAAAEERIEGVSGIIYTLTRQQCESIAARLGRHGIGARPYHAGLSTVDKATALSGWVAGRPGFDIIVATTAFGMGIDKGNVRFVVHWHLPKSFEGYYQEAGRAGRDGRASACIMYYGREDRDRAVSQLGREAARAPGKPSEAAAQRLDSLRALAAHAERDGCRHAGIVAYFGEARAAAVCDAACDWCKDAAAVRELRRRGLATEEWVSTQREEGAWAAWEEYE